MLILLRIAVVDCHELHLVPRQRVFKLFSDSVLLLAKAKFSLVSLATTTGFVQVGQIISCAGKCIFVPGILPCQVYGHASQLIHKDGYHY